MTRTGTAGARDPRTPLASMRRHAPYADASLEIIPMDGPLAAEIRGIDLRRTTDAKTRKALNDAWAEHLVLLFRGQHFENDEQLRAIQNFGKLQPPNPRTQPPAGEKYPELLRVQHIPGPADAAEARRLGAGEAFWHTDMSYIDEPPAGSALYAIEVPPDETGGQTCFSNMYLACETLPADLRKAVEGRRIVHDAAHNSGGKLRPGYDEVDDPRKTPGPQHPVLRIHPVTGREALFLGRRPYAWFVGAASVAESETLLDRLWEHASQERFAWCHHWRPGDIVLWDNRCAMHRRIPFDPSYRRVMRRAQIAGDRPV
jgi:taurine dioxygenase